MIPSLLMMSVMVRVKMSLPPPALELTMNSMLPLG